MLDLRGAGPGGVKEPEERKVWMTISARQGGTLAEHSYRTTALHLKGPDNRRKTSTRPETVRLELCSGLASIAPAATSKKSGLDLDKSNEPRRILIQVDLSNAKPPEEMQDLPRANHRKRSFQAK